MTHTLKKMVIHNLIKLKDSTSAETHHSDRCVKIDPTVNDLHNTLIHAFRRDLYSEFADSPEPNSFPLLLKSYLDGKQENADFVGFSKSALKLLSDVITNVFWAKGGYFVFSEFEDGRKHNVGIFTVRDTQGTIFVEEPAQKVFKVSTTKYVDTEKLVMACLINTTDWTTKKPEFLTINSPREISKYYFDWLVATKPETTKDYTDRYYDLLNAAKLPINPDTNESYDYDTFKKSNYEVINSKPDKKVNMQELSQLFYDDSEYLPNLAQEKELRIPSVFTAHNGSLMRFKFIDVESDGIRLRFNRGDYEPGANGKIRLNVKNPNQVIIESRDFASSLREKLEVE